MKKFLETTAPIIVGTLGVMMIIWAQFQKKTASLSLPTIGVMPVVIAALVLLLAISFYFFGFWPKQALRGGGKASAKAFGAAVNYAAPRVTRGVSTAVSGFQANPIFYIGIGCFGAALVMVLITITTSNMLARYAVPLLLGVSIGAFITYYDKWGTINTFRKDVAQPFLIAHKVAIWCVVSVVAFVWAITSSTSWFVIILSGISTLVSLIVFFNREEQALDLLWKGLVFGAKLLYKVLSGGKGADVAVFGWLAILLAVTFLSPLNLEIRKLTLMLTMLLFPISAILFFKNRVVK